MKTHPRHLTPFQIRQAIETLKDRISELEKQEPYKGREKANTLLVWKQWNKKIARYRSELKTCDFQLQRKTDETATKEQQQNANKQRRELGAEIAYLLHEPFDRQRFDAWVIEARKFIQTYNQ